MPASLSALGLCFICSCPGAALGDNLNPPLPAHPILQAAEEALCVLVLQCGRETLPVSSSALCPAFTSARPRVKGGTDLRSVLAKNGMPSLNSPGP